MQFSTLGSKGQKTHTQKQGNKINKVRGGKEGTKTMMITFSQQADSTDIIKATLKMYFSFQVHFPFISFQIFDNKDRVSGNQLFWT